MLGGDNGLRGYPLRYQAGDDNALMTLEQRFYSNWQPLKLFNVGAAVFFDAGRTWGDDEFAAPPEGGSRMSASACASAARAPASATYCTSTWRSR